MSVELVPCCCCCREVELSEDLLTWCLVCADGDKPICGMLPMAMVVEMALISDTVDQMMDETQVREVLLKMRKNHGLSHTDSDELLAGETSYRIALHELGYKAKTSDSSGAPLFCGGPMERPREA